MKTKRPLSTFVRHVREFLDAQTLFAKARLWCLGTLAFSSRSGAFASETRARLSTRLSRGDSQNTVRWTARFGHLERQEEESASGRGRRETLDRDERQHLPRYSLSLSLSHSVTVRRGSAGASARLPFGLSKVRTDFCGLDREVFKRQSTHMHPSLSGFRTLAPF